MGILPIVDRELRVAAGRPSTYRVRFWSALLTAFLVLAMLLARGRSPAEIGRQIFDVLSIAGMAYVLFSGVRCTADAISQEKREGTLGLLFLTDLKSYDVVLGKLVVTSIDAAYGLAAMLPLLGLPLILGAVTGDQFWRMNLVLLNTLFFSLSIGLLLSTFGQSERAVSLNTLVAITAVTFGLPLAWFVLSQLSRHRWIDWLFLTPSPAYAARLVLNTYSTPPSEFWWSMACIASLGLIALLVCMLLLPRIFQERSTGPATWQERWYRWRYHDVKFRRFQGGHWVDRQPFLWLLSRDRLSRTAMHSLTFLMIVFALSVPAFLKKGGAAESVVVFGSFGLHFLLKLLVAADVSRRFNADKRSGGLELLLATPLPVADMLKSQAFSTRTFFAVPALILGLLNIEILAERPNFLSELGPVYCGGLVVLGFDLYALSWLGMLNSLRETRYVQGVLRTVVMILGPLWVLFFFVMFGFQPGRAAQHVFFFWWFLAGIVWDVTVGRLAKRDLLRQFRARAAGDSRPIPLLIASRSSRVAPRLQTWK
jgi:ABC-type multidrug transport system permease subunit